jgi:hypothetical protein
MTRAALAAACVLALSAGGLGGSSPPQEERARAATDRGVLAVMRRDGLLIPFAAYKGSRWVAPWPVTARNRELPVNMSAIPDEWWGGTAPGTWQLHLPGSVTRPVSTMRPRVYRSFCDTRIGLVTDYRSTEPVPVPPTDPYPKDGLAISSEIEVLPIESVDRASPEMARLAETLKAELDTAEDKTLTLIRNRQGWTHPLKPAVRRVQPVTIEAWYRAPMDEPGWIASYIEAVRPYSAGLLPEDAGCGLETVFTGWIHQNLTDPRKTRVQLTARVTYCDRRGVKYMLPLGRIHIGSQQYWVYQFSGFDQEWYEVARMSPLKLGFVIESYGGGGREGCGFRPAPL